MFTSNICELLVFIKSANGESLTKGHRSSGMAGELLGESVVISDMAEGSQVYNKGYYGYPRPGGGLAHCITTPAR